jgi:acyl-CoA thioesterase-1
MTNSLPASPCQIWFKIIFLAFLLGGCSSEPERNSLSQTPNQAKQDNIFRILILGDSLTEGYGVSELQAYPTLLEEKLNQELAEDRNTTFKVINAGISGSTTSGGVSRIDWLLKSSPDFLVIALGGNDGLRGVPVEETKKNLEKIMQTALEKEIPALLAGMKIPPNYGMEYTRKFAQLFQDLATKHQVSLLPFLLEGVGGNPSMNLPDRIHPNPAGHQKISETLFKSLVSHLPKN